MLAQEKHNLTRCLQPHKKQDQNNFWDKEGNGIFMMCKHKTHPIIQGNKHFSWQTVFTVFHFLKDMRFVCYIWASNLPIDIDNHLIQNRFFR